MTYRRKKKRKRRTLNRVLDKMPHFPSMLNAPQDWTLQRKAWRTCHIIPLNVVSPNKAPLELKRNSYITVKQEYISTYYNIPEEREMHVHIIYYNRLTHGVLLSNIKKWTLVYPEKKKVPNKKKQSKGICLRSLEGITMKRRNSERKRSEWEWPEARPWKWRKASIRCTCSRFLRLSIPCGLSRYSVTSEEGSTAVV